MARKKATTNTYTGTRRTSNRPTVEALARTVNRAIRHDAKLNAAGLRPLPVRPLMVPIDPDRPDGRQVPATRQSGGPNRADRRFAHGKHQRRIARREALVDAARAVNA